MQMPLGKPRTISWLSVEETTECVACLTWNDQNQFLVCVFHRILIACVATSEACICTLPHVVYAGVRVHTVHDVYT